jgi:hypothetical protein
LKGVEEVDEGTTLHCEQVKDVGAVAKIAKILNSPEGNVAPLRKARGDQLKPMVIGLLIAVTAYPLSKHGQCPAGYSQSGAYCARISGKAKPAIPNVGQCPAGWVKSGDYCEKRTLLWKFPQMSSLTNDVWEK